MRVVSLLAVALLGLAACSSSPAPKSSQDAAQVNARLGIEYLRQGEIVKARDKIEKALKQDPQNPAAHIAAALLYERMNETDRVIEHYDTAIRLKPDDPETLNNYGVFLCRNNRAPEGAKLMVRAARSPLYRTPDVAFNNAGVCWRNAGRHEEAEQSFLEALKVQPRSTEALLQLAQMTFERSRHADARNYIKRYLDVAPPTAEILWLAVRTERALNNGTSAEAFEKRLKKEFPGSEQARALASAKR